MESKSSSIDISETNQSQSSVTDGENVLCEQEYETQYFGFTPKSFCDGVYNAAIEYINDDLEQVQKYIKQEFPDLMTDNMLHKASETMLMTFIKSFDKAFDKLEVYLMSNILHVPNNVLLPEDSVHSEQNATEDDDEKIDEDISELRKKIKYTKYLNSRLKQELIGMDKVTSEYNIVLKKLQTLERVVVESGVSELKDTMTFTVSKAKKLRDMLNVPPAMVQRAKRSVGEEIDCSGKKVKL